MPGRKTTIDTIWFKAKIEAKYPDGGGQRQLADELGVDPSTVTHLLRGERRMLVDELLVIHNFIDQPLDEVAMRAGVHIHPRKKRRTKKRVTT